MVVFGGWGLGWEGGLNLRRRDVYWLEQLVHGNLWSVGRAHDDPGSDLRH